jgi:uncharacterized protein YbjT (DUF2867 family)
MDVLVAGGTGFVGGPVCRVLSDSGHGVTVLGRSAAQAGGPDEAEHVAADITSDDLPPIVDGHDVAINLVALPAHRQSAAVSHETVHVEGTRNLVQASERTGVERFLQLSALGVENDSETAYFDAKRRAETIVRESSLAWTIYRPSVVFGAGCGFFEFLDTWLPPVVAPFPGGGEMLIQPLWVEDLAQMIAQGVDDDRHADETYRLGGPDQLRISEVIETVYPTKTVVPVPMQLAEIVLTLVAPLESIPFGTDQARFLSHDNIVEANDASAFGIADSELRRLADWKGLRGG